MWSKGIYLPGIDISHHSGDVDWRQVKESGVAFAFFKATEGIDFLDERFHENWANSRRERVIRGSYHFFVPNEDPVAQANHYLNVIGDILHDSDLPPVIDVESSPRYIYEAMLPFSIEERQQMLKTWLDVVEQATNRKPIIYTNLFTWRDFWGDTEKFIQYPLWIANIDVENPSMPANNWGGKSYKFWQYSFKGSVPGILNGAEAVDLNVFQGDLDNLKNWVGIEGERELPPILFNFQMLEALSMSANQFGKTVEDWILKTKLNYLRKSSVAEFPYDGPAINDLTLSDEEKFVLEEKVQEIITAYKESIYSRLTNQGMINAVYQGAKNLGIAGWTFLEIIELTDIVHNRQALYTGLKVHEMDQLSDEEKYALAESLGLNLVQFAYGTSENPISEEPISEEPVVEEPVVEEPVVEEPVVEEPVVEEPVEEEPVEEEPITNAPVKISEDIFGFPAEINNQDMINAVYKVADRFGLSGWAMLEFAGLTSLIKDRESKYSGVMINEMLNLSSQQRDALAEILGVVLIETPSEIIPSPVVVPELDSVKIETTTATYPGITNQDMLVCFSKAEKVLNYEGGLLISISQLQSIASAPDSLYTGPIVKNMIGLTVTQKAILLEMILEQGNNDGSETYPGLVNQDIINIFYKSAAEYSEDGWFWIREASLTYLAASREMRYKPYRGPKFEEMIEFSSEKKQTLLKFIGNA